MDKETEIKLEKRIKSLEKQMGAIFCGFKLIGGIFYSFRNEWGAFF